MKQFSKYMISFKTYILVPSAFPTGKCEGNILLAQEGEFVNPFTRVVKYFTFFCYRVVSENLHFVSWNNLHKSLWYLWKIKLISQYI